MSRLAFPFAPTPLGRSAAVERGSDAHVRQLLEQLIFTMPGERVMRPDFGSPVRQMVFGPAGGAAALALEAALEATIRQVLGDVLTLIDFSIAPGPGEGVVEIVIVYETRATKRTGELKLARALA